VTSRSSSTDADKAEQRAAAKRAAAQRAAARKRKDQLGVAAMVLAGIIAVGLIVGITVVLTHRGKNSTDTAAPADAKPSATAPAAEAPQKDFPAVPKGADPALKTEPKVTKGDGDEPTDLVVKKLITGKGAVVKTGQTISVNYTGVLYKSGAQFDSSWKRKQAAEFPIGTGGVIPGWDKGLVGLPVGTRVQLDIPAKLAYGENPQAGYPKGALRFVVDILAAK
jgi:peptidylprolyl isomerase